MHCYWYRLQVHTAQLDVDTSRFELGVVERFGACLIEYASRIDVSVSSTTIYGYTKSIIRDSLTESIERPENVFDLYYINFLD